METRIAYIPHAEIDKAKWDALLDASPMGLVYAYTGFLDAMSPGWEALVAGDYEYVMPLTRRKKMGIAYLCQPAFCQQLGVFGHKPPSAPVMEAFLRKMVQNFRLIEIYLNEANFTESVAATHTNFVLALGKPYPTLKAGYRKDLVKNLARAQKFNFSYLATNHVKSAIGHYKSLYGNKLGYGRGDFAALENVCEKWMDEGKCLVREVYLDDANRHELMAIGLFLKDHKRIYNIASSTLPNGRTLEANHYLFDRLIEEFSGQNLLLDFEGSDLPGVSRFYQKFSPENRPYFFWKSNRLPRALRWLKQ